MSSDPALALHSLTGPAHRKGLSLRPPRQLLRLLHLAREYAAAVAFRPISFGNLSYLQERIEELSVLGREIEALLPSLSAAWRERAQSIASMLAHCSADKGPQAFAAVVQACDRTNYRSFWERNSISLPAYSTPVLTRDYDTIIVATGPALGLGDEISCSILAEAIRSRWNRAAVEVYSFYAGLWPTLAPSFKEYTTNGSPLRIFTRIDDMINSGRSSSTLVVFINFTGLSFHMLYSMESSRPDIVEISIGRGTAWYMPHTNGPIQVLHQLDSIYPNNYTALQLLASRLMAAAPAATPVRPRRRSQREEYRIVVNPLTSKPILLTPEDWAALIGGSLASISPARTVRCTVLPGLAAASWEYAHAIAGALQKHGVNCTTEVLNDNRPLAAGTAFRQVVRCLQQADILIGIDTYTAHLAALLNVPSLALCYERNSAFWAMSAESFWVELNHDVRFLTEVVSLLMELTGASARPLLSGWSPPSLPDSTPIDSNDFREIMDAYDAAWETLPGRVQNILNELDKSHTWPAVRGCFSPEYPSSEAANWMFGILHQSHFSKLCRLIHQYRPHL